MKPVQKRGGERAKAGNRLVKSSSISGGNGLAKTWGIEGVDLYGGTKHSSATALADDFSPEQIIKATMHDTNKAFLRYCQTRPEHVKKLYESSRKPRGRIRSDNYPPIDPLIRLTQFATSY